MEEILGCIKIFAGNFAPKGSAFCDGRLMQIATNTALFSILGTTYGGDGITNFALPMLKSPAENANLHYIICLEGLYPQRD